MKRMLSVLVLVMMLPSLVLGGEVALSGLPTSQTAQAQLLPAEDSRPVMLVQAQTGTGAARDEEPRYQRSHSWDTFWDVHFGGYRWAWWALAGGILIAIHANAD